MSAQLFTISSLAFNPDGLPLYLHAEAYTMVGLVIVAGLPAHWEMRQEPATGGYMFVNAASGGALASPPNNPYVYVAQETMPSSHNTWTLMGDADSKALCPVYNSDLVLNIAGNSWTTESMLIVWPWDDQPNSKWRIDPV